MINHLGKQIVVSKDAIDELTKRNLLDRSTYPPRFKSQYFTLYKELEAAGERKPFYKELGEDLSGPNIHKCCCRECAEKALADFDQRYSKIYEHSDVDQLIAQIKRNRKYA